MPEADFSRILLTGGSGRLGRELCALLPGIVAPPRKEMDLLELASLESALERYEPALVVHAAAYTDVAKAEEERAACWHVNVDGTRHLVGVALAHGLPLVHISTDYVFYGDRGRYREDEPPGPVRNYYALTKLVAEAMVRTLPRHLVIRTSFRPREWPYPVAYDDLYTSQDYLDVIAPEIALAITRLESIGYDTLHIATERKSAYVLARRRRQDVARGSRKEAKVALPEDISLDISRWQALKREWQA
jgi:dTDP-4-dehydrorhamnose reductase